MQPAFTLFSIIMLVGAAHGMFLALTLLNTRDARGTGHAFLAIFTFAFAIDLGHEFLYQSRYLLDMLALAYTDPIINLVYGPAIYLYVRAITGGISYKFTGLQWLHVLPVALAIIVCVTLPELSKDQFIHLYYNDADPVSSEEVHVHKIIGRIALASVISIGVYIALSTRCLVRHARQVKQQFSSIEKLTLNWLRTLLFAFSLLYFILVFDGFFSDILGIDEDLNSLLYLMVVVVIYSIGYMGMRQPAIFTSRESAALLESTQLIPQSSLVDKESDKSGVEAKYKTSALDSEMSAALRNELVLHMRAEKPYLESKLTLPQLAKQLGISPNYLSQVINEQLQKNFFDFINEYRIDEAKNILARTDKKTTSITSVAYDSGFNSKSAFYTAFKKHVEMTPSEYRKSS